LINQKETVHCALNWRQEPLNELFLIKLPIYPKECVMTHENEEDQVELIEETIEGEEQTFTFDKFMDDIIIKESVQRPVLKEETPQREYVKRYIERAANRIKYVKVK